MLLGYARVSTLDQNLDLQLDALKQAGCERMFTDQASGSRTDRRGLAEAQSHLREGDTLVVWKLDRLGRTVLQLVGFVNDLAARGVAFRSLTDGIDTSTPAGRFFFHVMASLAEMERDLIRERTRAGLAAARARGRKGGRKPKLSPDQVSMVRSLMKTSDKSMADIAALVGISRQGLYRTLDRVDGKGRLPVRRTS
jgi:DNA invertase Pin-like site-specific DNA recombinase